MTDWPRKVGIEGGRVAVPPADSAGVRVFKGLPYAGSTAGLRRWRDPAPVEPWTGVRSAADYGFNCPQPRLVAAIDPTVPGMSEDCLSLNIWTGAPAPDDRRPVVVWIPGGAFLVAKSDTPRPDGAAFVQQGVVLVTINYRVGVFGFLAHPELTARSPHGASGNYGLLDQIAALRWVRDNITNFGGDPGRVTIMGHSAGGSSVNILMVSPLARGLFHGAIGLGGSAMPATGLNDGSPLPRAVEEAKGLRFAAHAKAGGIDDLRAMSAEALVTAAGAAIGDWAWNACIDGHVLPEPPAAILAAGRQNDVPLMVGWGADEGATMASDSFGGDDTPFAARIDAGFGPTVPRMHALYPSATLEQDRAAKAALAGDGFIVFPTWSWAVGQVRAGTAPVYVSKFGFAPRRTEGWSNVVPLLGPAGAFHGAQMPYIMGWVDQQASWVVDETDRQISADLAPLFANFIRSGDPNGPGLAAWPAYDLSHPQRLTVGRDGTVGACDDDDYPRLEALGRIFAEAPPGALRYRGMDAGDDP